MKMLKDFIRKTFLVSKMQEEEKLFSSSSFIFSLAAKKFQHIVNDREITERTLCIDISFFVSCFNESKFIISSLTTLIDAMIIIKKTYEIIVVDDGSTDASVQLIKDFIKHNPHINITLCINNKNKG